MPFPPPIPRATLLNSLESLPGIALDPYPVGGGVTQIELSLAGVPTVTLPGKQTVIRQAKALGAVVCETLDEYVEKAVELAKERWRTGGLAPKAEIDVVADSIGVGDDFRDFAIMLLKGSE